MILYKAFKKIQEDDDDILCPIFNFCKESEENEKRLFNNKCEILKRGLKEENEVYDELEKLRNENVYYVKQAKIAPHSNIYGYPIIEEGRYDYSFDKVSISCFLERCIFIGTLEECHKYVSHHFPVLDTVPKLKQISEESDYCTYEVVKTRRHVYVKQVYGKYDYSPYKKVKEHGGSYIYSPATNENFYRCASHWKNGIYHIMFDHEFFSCGSGSGNHYDCHSIIKIK